ncbi:hypothetical protein [Cryobacterium sp. GrIS_2_6]|uniref:hypothetical protein n=1 Tax=Cryobacterium sp. GrIS_2_6 TaxID=3162785 RepID=UPI002E069F97|nr:hypothetical protein [Cryobacterium psychrotolerans]MEC5149271.1 hypothetical protein [Cryobacterium psychrotolerans]MEC5149350.1 hypothetical protein [Cryobacterium psychrotolerans]
MNAAQMAFARDLADPDFSLSVPNIAKDVIRQLVEEVEALSAANTLAIGATK